jgi:hypothetical protein
MPLWFVIATDYQAFMHINLVSHIGYIRSEINSHMFQCIVDILSSGYQSVNSVYHGI